MTVVYAPRHLVDGIVARQEVLQKLFGNGWVTLACIDPEDGRVYTLQRDLQWQANFQSSHRYKPELPGRRLTNDSQWSDACSTDTRRPQPRFR